MKNQAELRRWAVTKYRRNHRAWITEPRLDVTFSLGIPTETQALADPDAFAGWATSWRRWRGPDGAELEWATRNWPSWGRQKLPARVRVTSAEALAELAGQAAGWRGCRQTAGAIRSRWPESSYLADGLPGLIDDAAALDHTDLQRLLAMTAWLTDHPDSGLMPRMVAVPGVDTKWLERHRGLVERLLTAVTGQVGTGLAEEPQRFRIRILDDALEGSRLHDLTTGVAELDRLALAPAAVLIVENLTTLAGLPPLPGVVAVHGRGHAVVQLDQVGWIADSPVLYWGDLDTHGFNILSRARGRLPEARSVLMDAETLHRFRSLAVPEPTQAHGVAGLTETEEATYRELESGHLRLEQERIPMGHAVGRLQSALAGIFTLSNPRSGTGSV